jgi:hypothetical protein
MKRKTILITLVALISGLSALHAQTNANLKQGVYRFSGIQGMALVVIQNTLSAAEKNITIHDADGNVAMRGKARISGTRVNVDYGHMGFETWAIVDNETFTDDNYGMTWRWLRDFRKEEL